MKRSNKKGFTLIEMVIVVWIISFLLYISQSPLWVNLWNAVQKQVVKDYFVNVVNEIEGYSYNNKTVSQELLKGDDTVNTEISRFNNSIGKINNSNSKVAFYHWLYFTTKSNDTVDTTLSHWKNGAFYLVQYRQEGYISLSPRRLEPLVVDPRISNQLLKLDWYKWAKKYKFPLPQQYYLNKIVLPTSSCKDGLEEMAFWEILFSVSNLNFRFYNNWNEDKTFNYKFCFSWDEDTFDEDKFFSFKVNRESLKELYFESLRN